MKEPNEFKSTQKSNETSPPFGMGSGGLNEVVCGGASEAHLFGRH